jgi:predicted ArsR family transcriptional regulator
MTEGKTRRAIVRLLKQEGALDSISLSRRLKLTPMAVRQHLYDLQREKLVTAEARPGPVGRPAKHWQLTREADRLFPDAYAELTLALIGAMGKTLDGVAMQKVLDARVAAQRDAYVARIAPTASLPAKLRELARMRTEEGYMAEVRRDGTGFLFIENHCPICAAANACQGFCSTEMQLFQSVLGPNVSVERVEHILNGSRRCAYRVTTRQGAAAARR